MKITISHDANEDAMGFASESEVYDFVASLEKYEDMVLEKLKKEFPGYEIEIDREQRGYIVDDGDDDVLCTVEIILSDIFGGFEWLVPFEKQLTYEYKLEIYQVIDEPDCWPLVETIVACSPDDCYAEAEKKYNLDEYHWTTPVIA